jgi:4-aminobutyrate aminotransferase
VVRRDEELIMQSFARWYPLVIARGYGSVVEDVDGNLYVDYNAGIAVTATGHAHPKVVEAVKRQSELSSTTRSPTSTTRSPSSWPRSSSR